MSLAATWTKANLGSRLLRFLPGPRDTPLTLGYLAVLLATTATLGLVDQHTASNILAASSTDAAHLVHEPVRVLLASLLWLPSLDWLPWAAGFAVVLAPVERRIGTRWTAVVFLSGHVLATLATELPVFYAVTHGVLPVEAAHRLDVGVSYGFYAVSGVLVGLLAAPARQVVLVVAGTTVLVALVIDPDVTNVGHLLSLLTGLAWWPWLRRRGLSAIVRPRWSVDCQESRR